MQFTPNGEKKHVKTNLEKANCALLGRDLYEVLDWDEPNLPNDETQVHPEETRIRVENESSKNDDSRDSIHNDEPRDNISSSDESSSEKEMSGEDEGMNSIEKLKRKIMTKLVNVIESLQSKSFLSYLAGWSIFLNLIKNTSSKYGLRGMVSDLCGQRRFSRVQRSSEVRCSK